MLLCKNCTVRCSKPKGKRMLLSVAKRFRRFNGKTMVVFSFFRYRWLYPAVIVERWLSFFPSIIQTISQRHERYHIYADCDRRGTTVPYGDYLIGLFYSYQCNKAKFITSTVACSFICMFKVSRGFRCFYTLKNHLKNIR